MTIKYMRILNTETVNKVGEEVLLKGWVNARRDMGKIAFLDMRDRSGIVQVVGVPSELDEKSKEELKKARSEYVLEIKGMVQARGVKQINAEVPTGTVEVLAKEIKILAKAEPLPLDLEDDKISLDVHLDYLPLTLRTEKWRALFKIQAEIVRAFRDYLNGRGFTEIQAPKIVAAAAEGGADVFEVKYLKNEAT